MQVFLKENPEFSQRLLTCYRTQGLTLMQCVERGKKEYEAAASAADAAANAALLRFGLELMQ